MTRGASAICTLVSAYTFSLFFVQQILIKVSCSGIVIKKQVHLNAKNMINHCVDFG